MRKANLMNWLWKVAEGLVEDQEGERGSRFRKSVRYEQVWHGYRVGFLLTKVSIYFGFLLPLLLSLPGQRLQVASYSGRVVRTGSSVCPCDIITSASIFSIYPTLRFWLGHIWFLTAITVWYWSTTQSGLTFHGRLVLWGDTSTCLPIRGLSIHLSDQRPVTASVHEHVLTSPMRVFSRLEIRNL